ncbi:MAG: hypothetical protein WA790_00560 [Sulfitobacter sp.]
MVEIDDIVDRDSFKMWLDALPQDGEAEKAKSRSIMVAFAMRSAARILPHYWHIADGDYQQDNKKVNVLPILQCILTSYVATISATLSLINAANSASLKMNAEVTSDGKSVLGRTLSGDITDIEFRNPFVSVPSTVLEAVAHSAVKAVGSGVDTSLNSSNAAQAAAIAMQDRIWAEIRGDCRHLLSAPDLSDRALWAETGSAPEDIWPSIKSKILNQPNDWGFWVEWYDRLLAGKPKHVDLLTKIALIAPEDWDKGASVVNPIINKMWKEFEGEAPRIKSEAHENDIAADVASQAKPNTPISRQTVDRVRNSIAENRKNLPPTFDALQELILLEIERWQTSNLLNAKIPDECVRQVRTYLVMYEAIQQMRDCVPSEGKPTEVQAEKAIGLGTLYLEKLKSLPREKADEVVEGLWDIGRNSKDLGIVLGTTAVFSYFSLPLLSGVAVGTVLIAPKKVNQIIGAAKDYVKNSGSISS